MIDKRLYQETFSHLRASDQAKQEVFQKMQEMKHRKRMPRVLRGAAIAAAIACMDGGEHYTLRSVKRTRVSGRSAWGQAGVVAYTEPF